MLSSGVQLIEKALKSNPKCETGLLIHQRVFGIAKGPSGSSELLAMVYADDPSFGYWYGHILVHPSQSSFFLSTIVRSQILVNASTVPLQFARFHYWLKDRLKYEPCSFQHEEDVYAESDSMFAAAHKLAAMIAVFDVKKRNGCPDGPYADSPIDYRILDVYGIKGAFDDDGCWEGPPMPTALSVVTSHS